MPYRNVLACPTCYSTALDVVVRNEDYYLHRADALEVDGDGRLDIEAAIAGADEQPFHGSSRATALHCRLCGWVPSDYLDPGDLQNDPLRGAIIASLDESGLIIGARTAAGNPLRVPARTKINVTLPSGDQVRVSITRDQLEALQDVVRLQPTTLHGFPTEKPEEQP